MSGGVTNIINFLNMAVLASAPLLLATLGEILTEKSGNLNLGVEGMMYMGAVIGFWAGYTSGSFALPEVFVQSAVFR